MPQLINTKTGFKASSAPDNWNTGGGYNPEDWKIDNTTPVPSPSPTPTPTVADVYGEVNFETPEEKAFREQTGAGYKSDATGVIDEEAIRRNTMDRFQSEIDALNRVYAEKKRVEGIAGEGRMGSTAAVEARRGLLGSDFGTAQENTQSQANKEAVDAIESERAYKEGLILSEARDLASSEYEKKTAAKKLGAENYLKFISENSARKKANAEAIAKRLYESKTFDTANLQEIADSLGISIEALKATYNSYKKTQETSKENIKLNAGESIYNPNTGKIEYTAPKESKQIALSPGETLVDETGKTLFTMPPKPTDPMDYVKTVGDSLLQYDPTSGKWNTMYTAPEKATDQKIVKIDGEDFIQNPDGSYTKPKVPTIPSAQKVEKAQGVISQIDAILNNPKLSKALGPIQGSMPTALMSGDVSTLATNINSLIANIALENLGLLKGPMSDKDLAFIKEASTGLNRTMSTEGFVTQLNKIKQHFNNIKGTFEKESTAPTDLKTYYNAHPEKQENIDKLINENPDITDEDIMKIVGFNNVGSDTNSATLTKAIEKPDGTKGGQCGRFVNNITGLKLGDSLKSKMDKMDPTITQPEPGMVFVMPYKETGHTGIIVSVNDDGTATVKDSNYNLDEKVKTHKIALNKMTGFRKI